MILNKGSVERGFKHATVYKSEVGVVLVTVITHTFTALPLVVPLFQYENLAITNQQCYFSLPAKCTALGCYVIQCKFL